MSDPVPPPEQPENRPTCDYDEGRAARQPWPCDVCPHSDYGACLEAKISRAGDLP